MPRRGRVVSWWCAKVFWSHMQMEPFLEEGEVLRGVEATFAGSEGQARQLKQFHKRTRALPTINSICAWIDSPSKDKTFKQYKVDPHRYRFYPHNYIWLDYFSLRQCQSDFDDNYAM